MNSTEYLPIWKKAAIRIGSPTNLLAAVTAFIPVIYLCMTYDCWPDLNVVLAGWGMTAASFGAFYIVEPVSYYASLGISGTYLSFMSGNIGNMRMPCSALALDVTKSETGSLQAEVVSTMAICGSIVTNLIATTSAAIFGAAIVAVIPTALKVGLQTYASTAIFAAMAGNVAIKKPLLALFGIIIPIVCKLYFRMLPAWVVIIICVFGTLAIARIMYNMRRKSA